MSDLYENVDVTNFPPPLNVASKASIMEHCKLDAEGFQRLLDLRAIRPWGIQRVEYFTPNGSAKFDPENSDREKVQELYRAENARRLAVGLPLLAVPTTPTRAFSQGVTINSGEVLNTDGTEPDLDDLTEAQLEALTRPADSIPATDETQSETPSE